MALGMLNIGEEGGKAVGRAPDKAQTTRATLQCQ
eukprot:CAMPEP_0174384942 /NCGR_PEP_ID=MMETSP0811_2-20130205/126254_1 /TAXON_ID=73025 ORGANISM="Eutreptiella gymnastica-like, Strain CCMP1594" /NCGR_SAMPLE_ID=MMETSP0811_2 /ASSEMBLY_ACC=CAM_ASM_000667 /LENGTH=33 /DNA_ID= /DNA_START= /DNA_END= /DNA_ORIENTATION=